MLTARDLNTFHIRKDITVSGKVRGYTDIQYEVLSYTDTRNDGCKQAYMVACTQRLIVTNYNGFISDATSVSSFTNYPIMIGSSVALNAKGVTDTTGTLVNYAPRTLNSSISSTTDNSANSATTFSSEYSSGSSFSTTNSYSVSGSLGFFGDSLTGSVSAGTSNSTTNARSRSTTNGASVNHGAQVSSAIGMSIKDWASYAQFKKDGEIGWVFGQEYPWNVIRYRDAPTGGNIHLPQGVQDRLFCKGQLFPPSEIALFGTDFCTSAAWVLEVDPTSKVDPTLSAIHQINPSFGTHSIGKDSKGKSVLEVQLRNTPADPIKIGPIDLALLGLDPALTASSGSPVIGFIDRRFDIPPDAGASFAIRSPENDLLVRGAGFNTGMTTDFSAPATHLTVSFKLLDLQSDVVLSLKHFTDAGKPCRLKIKVNDVALRDRIIDAAEERSGGSNVSEITLRDRDFSSADFCDYLQAGLNEVSIAIEPDTGVTGARYTLVAMALS